MDSDFQHNSNGEKIMAENISKKRLGRGLAALIGEMDQPVVVNNTQAEVDNLVPVEYVRANPNNPRQQFGDDGLADLASSIREHGIVQPILVRPIVDAEDARYEIIAGERRWRAAQLAEVHQIPIIIRDVADKQALEIAIIESVQRSDLNAIEEAQGYQQLVDGHHYTQADLARVIGKSRSHVANTLRLLKLPENVCAMVAAGSLSAGHARALVTVENPEVLANRIINEGLSVRQIETLVQPTAPAAEKNTREPKKVVKDADTKALERSLSDLLGLKVAVSFKDDGAGDIKISYRSLDQLDDICRRLQH